MTRPYLGESRGEMHQLVWELSSIKTADATLVVLLNYHLPHTLPRESKLLPTDKVFFV